MPNVRRQPGVAAAAASAGPGGHGCACAGGPQLVAFGAGSAALRLRPGSTLAAVDGCAIAACMYLSILFMLAIARLRSYMTLA